MSKAFKICFLVQIILISQKLNAQNEKLKASSEIVYDNKIVNCSINSNIQNDTILLNDLEKGSLEKRLNANKKSAILLTIIDSNLYYNELELKRNQIKELELFLYGGKIIYDKKDTFLFNNLEYVAIINDYDSLPIGLYLSPNLKAFMSADRNVLSKYNTVLNLVLANPKIESVGFNVNPISYGYNLEKVKINNNKLKNKNLNYLGLNIDLSLNKNIQTIVDRFPNITILYVDVISKIETIKYVKKLRKMKQLHVLKVNKEIELKLSKIKYFDIYIDSKKIN